MLVQLVHYSYGMNTGSVISFMVDTSEELRRNAIREAGKPKKGYHWTLWRYDREGTDYQPVETKTQFESKDGKLVAERASRDRYTVLDRETSYIVAIVPGRTHAKDLVAELGPTWAEKMKQRNDPEVVRGIRMICAKHQAKYY